MILIDSSIFTLCKIYDFKFNFRLYCRMNFFIIIIIIMMRGFMVIWFDSILFTYIVAVSLMITFVKIPSTVIVICMVISAEMNYAYILLLLLPSSYSLQRCILLSYKSCNCSISHGFKIQHNCVATVYKQCEMDFYFKQ